MLHPFRVLMFFNFSVLSRRFSPGYHVAAFQAAPLGSPTGSYIVAQGNALGYCRLLQINRTLKGCNIFP